MDVLLGGVFNHVVALEDGVALELVGGRDNTGGVDDGLEVGNRVVGDTDGAGLGLGELGHGLPGVDDGDVVHDEDIAAFGIALGLHREEVVASLEGDGPVDEVKVEVFELELGKTLIKGLLDNSGVVLGVPELGGLEFVNTEVCCLTRLFSTYDEEVLTLKAGNILVGALDTLSNLTLVLVDGGQIQVTVAGLQGLVNSLADLAGGRLPGTKSQLAINS